MCSFTRARSQLAPGFEMLANAQNKSMLNLSSTAQRVHGFATWVPLSNAVELFVINKFEEAQNVTIDLPTALHECAVASDGHPVQHVCTKVVPVPPTQAVSVIDTDDHWGTQVQSSIACVAHECTLLLPAVSFTRIY